MTTDEILRFEKERRRDEMRALQNCKWCGTFGDHYCPHWIAKSIRPEDEVLWLEIIKQWSIEDIKEETA